MADLSALKAIVGPKGWSDDPSTLSPLLAEPRDLYKGATPLVLRPTTTEQVAAIVSECHKASIPLVPQGGNTGLCGGATPDKGGEQVLISLARMNKVRAIDPLDYTITVEAGCILQNIQQAAEDVDRLFPLSLGAEGSCVIGGNLSTNAGGINTLRFGNARDLVLGLEVVLPDGRVWNGLRLLRKDNTGYDLKHLFIGAEGSLGIITAATLKLFPAPAARFTALAACPSLDAAVELLGLARARAGDALTGFEVMNHASRALVARQLPQLQQPLANAAWTVLLELSDAEGSEHAQQLLEALLGTALERGGVQDAAVAQSLQQAQAFWQLREAIPLAQAQAGLNIKHDIALPVSEIAGFIAEMDGTLAAYLPGIEVIDFGHLGDGNLHYNVQAPAGVAPAEFLATHETAINAMVHDAVQRRGGSISAEHGIGRLKRDELARRKDPTALALMRAIKQALDPLGIMNPGRVL